MIILCKERSGLNFVIYIVDKNPSDDDINFLSLRRRTGVNSEYYITNLDEEIIVMLKNNPSKKLFIRL